MAEDPDLRSSRLYAVPLEEFTAARNALAAELKAEGDTEGAAAVKALRKPSRAAWAVNQLVRSEPELVDALMGAGGELRQAHRQAASGKGAAQLRAAAEAERAAVEQLLARAPSVLGHPLTPALIESIRNSLHAASSDDEARELVRSGTLTNPLRPVGLGPVPAPTAAAGPRRSGRGRDQEDAEAKRRSAEMASMLKAAKNSEAALRRDGD